MKSLRQVATSSAQQHRQLLWVIAGVSVASLTFLLPWHMDEFIMYHALACTSPSQQLNEFSQACSEYAAQLGPFHYHLSYPYIGVASSLLISPVLAVTGSLASTYVLGVIALAAICAGIAVALRLSVQWLPVIALYFPLSFIVIHDGGPVRIGLLVFVWSPYVVRRFLRAGRLKRIALATLLALAWTLATEDKPFFVFLIPGVIAFSVASLSAHGMVQELRAQWKQLCLLFAVAAATALALLVTVHVDGRSYLSYLSEFSGGRRTKDLAYSALSGAFNLVDWPYHLHRIADFHSLGSLHWPHPADLLAQFIPWGSSPNAIAVLALTVLSSVGVIALFVYSFVIVVRGGTKQEKATLTFLVAGASITFLCTVLAVGLFTHHFIYTQVYLLSVVLTAFSLRGGGAWRLASCLVPLTIAILLVNLLTPTTIGASREIQTVMTSAVRAADAQTVINCASWGCYYPFALENKDNIPVTFADSSGTQRELENLAIRESLQILQACNSCELAQVQREYPDSRVTELAVPTRIWRLFRVTPGN